MKRAARSPRKTRRRAGFLPGAKPFGTWDENGAQGKTLIAQRSPALYA